MEALAKRFNTDDGIWRATMAISQYSIPSGRGEFQYRERYVEGCNRLEEKKAAAKKAGFNTENGMWRAAILCP